MAFKKGSGGTITINGTAFTPESGGRGPAGPAGPPGSIAVGNPAEAAGPINVTAGAAPAPLATVQFTNSDGKAHRLLMTGGFSAECAGCTAAVAPAWSLTRSGAAGALVTRRLTTLGTGGITQSGASISEVIVSPEACGPCSLTLNLAATTAGSTPQTIAATDIRLTLVDLGPA